MSLLARTIGAHDLAHQPAFLRYVPKVFPELDFRDWHASGGWNDDYTAFALFDGDEIVASASVGRMQCVVRGRDRHGYQLSAVGVLPEARGRGLGRAVVERALSSVPDGALCFLFGNESVLEFYPQFGFTRMIEHLFVADVDLAPAGPPLPKLSRSQPDHHRLLEQLGARAQPVTAYFGARDYGSVAAWYLGNAPDYDFHHLPEVDAVLVTEQAGSTLTLLEVLAPTTLDLDALLPHIVRSPVRRLALGFTPDRYCRSARPAQPVGDAAPLFVRGDLDLDGRPFKFPALAQT